jgi:hypothetical protein
VQTGSGGERSDPADTHRAMVRGREVVVAFIHHAVDRFRSRGITREQVIQCLQFPDARGLEADEGRERVGRYEADGSRRLDVVYETGTDENGQECWTVISAFWMSGRRI